MDTSDVRSAKELFTPLGVLILLAVLITFDLVADFWVGMSVGHFVLELCLIGASALAARVLWKRVQAEREAMRAAHARLEEEHARLRLASETWQGAAEHWREQNRSLVEGLSEAIDRQLGEWGLSEAESDVALLLLKGLALKEIADIRRVSERTVREQARAIYRKSELANRSELAAFFLEDLLSPRTHTESEGTSKEAKSV
ncbi:LuxR C-terminal-related transcriptional regulator [Myxococcota bacterium]|nr:LuxR C-terminal-related transcriptional regulator [Myxococcota bacterium]